jgi:tetraacyldisaccharide 4'-kinase
MAPAACYHAVQKIRADAYSWRILSGKKAAIPVLSVGNLLMGGSGKTPFTIYLAGLLLEMGFRPAIVSRGYRGSNRDKFLVVNDGRSDEPLVAPSVSGDEPFLMAKRLPQIPVLVGRRRIHAVEAAKKLLVCNVALLDDGFQHLQLERDLDIVLLNGTEDQMFPLGCLREPMSALARADIVALVGSASMTRSAARYAHDAPVFRCRSVPAGLRKDLGYEENLSPSEYTSREVVLMSGIANPERFRQTAEGLQWRVLDHRVYPDHHVFSDAELAKILSRWPGTPIVTTEKDWVKLPEWFKKTNQVMALRIDIVMEEESAFRAVLQKTIGARIND